MTFRPPLRDGQIRALRFSPNPQEDELYPKGSIVVCYACGKPLYKLQAAIFVTDKPSRTAWKYAPVSLADLQTIIARTDLDPGLRAAIKFMTPDEQRAHVEKIPTLKAGDALTCSACGGSFVFGRTSETQDGRAEFTDRAFVIQLATIPPVGKARRLSRVRG